MGWKCIYIPKLQRCNRLGMDKWFNPTLYWACDYLSMLEIELIQVSKRRHWQQNINLTQFYDVIWRRHGLVDGMSIVDRAMAWYHQPADHCQPCNKTIYRAIGQVDVLDITATCHNYACWLVIKILSGNNLCFSSSNNYISACGHHKETSK